MRLDSRLLADAFQDDPLFAKVLPNEARRRRVLPWLMGRNVSLAERVGSVDRLRVDGTPTQDPADTAGIALWFAPGVDPFEVRHVLASGLAAAPFVIGPAATSRMVSIFRASDSYSADLPDDWYLFMLAVGPEAKGRGLGRKLLERGFERADATGAGVKLETNNESNLGFYGHLGLTQVAHHRENGLDEWLLRRPPSEG